MHVVHTGDLGTVSLKKSGMSQDGNLTLSPVTCGEKVAVLPLLQTAHSVRYWPRDYLVLYPEPWHENHECKRIY